MTNKNNATGDLSRIKQLMSYGLNESESKPYSNVELSKMGADGNRYGIVREGTQYCIKVAKDARKDENLSENYEYITGFRNRKDFMCESFAKAERKLTEKLVEMRSNYGSKSADVIKENYTPNNSNDVMEEGTKLMMEEIARQRQIMKNASNIMKGKACCCDKCDTPKVKEEKAPKDAANVANGGKSNPGDPFSITLSNSDLTKNEHGNLKGAKKKPVKESAETPLSSRENPDYIDDSKGTEIGSTAPFDNSVNVPADSVVEEGESMHDSDNQNTPVPGTGEVGKAAPFDEKTVNESLDDLDDTLEDGDEGDLELDDDTVDGDFEDEPEGDEQTHEEGEGEQEPDADGEETEVELEVDADKDSDIETRISSLEDKLDQILNAINAMKYDDEPLYSDDDDDDDNEGIEGDDEFGNDEGTEGEGDEDEDEHVYESKSYRRLMRNRRRVNEENDFGKHPAYQKVVMSTPTNQHQEMEGYYDMNDDSVNNTAPYGTKKGSSAPFEGTRKDVEDKIVEYVIRELKKKI